MNILYTALILFAMSSSLFAGQSETIVQLETANGTIEGSLLVPKGKTGMSVALIISGSGPTDRDGNNPAMKNNSLKLLATELWKNGIASLRYDKRGIGKSRNTGLEESDLRFEHYIEDSKRWIAFLKKDKRFNQILVIGHSEGSLIGLITSQETGVDKFISIAGVGQSADKTLKEQLKSQPPAVLKMSSAIIDKLVSAKDRKSVV